MLLCSDRVPLLFKVVDWELGYLIVGVALCVLQLLQRMKTVVRKQQGIRIFKFELRVINKLSIH